MGSEYWPSSGGACAACGVAITLDCLQEQKLVEFVVLVVVVMVVVVKVVVVVVLVAVVVVDAVVVVVVIVVVVVGIVVVVVIAVVVVKPTSSCEKRAVLAEGRGEREGTKQGNKKNVAF